MPKINKIKLSGTSYDIQDSNASKTVTLTQAQYDALQTKDPNTFYIISDGETFDPSEKVDTSAFTAYSASVETSLSGKAAQSDLNTLSGTVTGHTGDTTIHVTASDKATWNAKSDFSGDYNDLSNKLSAGTNISIVDNVISAEGGGGKAVTGGTNISITTGETADTINCTIPFESDNNGNLLFGYNFVLGAGTRYALGISQKNSTTGTQTKITALQGAIAIGNGIKISGVTGNGGEYSVALGNNANVYGVQSTALGVGCNASGNTTLAIGRYSTSKGNDSVAIGNQANVSGNSSVAIGRLAKVSGDSSVAIGSGATANGVDYKTNINNQLTIDTSNQVYIYNKDNTEMICLQDQLGGGSDINVVQTTGTSTADVMSQDAVTTQLNNKANKSAAVGGYKFGSTNNANYIQYTNVNRDNIGNSIYYPTINGKGILTNNSTWAQNNYNFQLVETSAITTSITSSSTDVQVPSAKAVYDAIQEGGGGSSVVELTQAQYDALTTIDPDTIYVITDAAGGDLSNYYTKAQINAMIGDIESLLAAI